MPRVEGLVWWGDSWSWSGLLLCERQVLIGLFGGAPGVRLGDGGRPVRAVERNAEDGEAGKVGGGSAGVDVGGDTNETATSRFAATPEPADEVGDLAFHDGAVGPIALDPVGSCLLGAGRGQDRFVAVDGDRATSPGGGAVSA